MYTIGHGLIRLLIFSDEDVTKKIKSVCISTQENCKSLKKDQLKLAQMMFIEANGHILRNFSFCKTFLLQEQQHLIYKLVLLFS